MSAGNSSARVALITGAAGTMGAASAVRLAADGYRVALVDIVQDRVNALAAQIGDASAPVIADLSTAEGAARAVSEAERALGSIDILVNNAGILSNNKIADTTPEEWHRVLGINLDSAFHLSRAVLPGMKSRRFGRIVNTCSYAMKSGGLTAGTAYTVSKGALQALTFSLAREFAAFGITVNGIAPAYVKTPMVTEALTEAQRQALIAQIPVGRFCEPEEFAHVVAFLISPLAGFITGEIIDLNGGLQFD